MNGEVFDEIFKEMFNNSRQSQSRYDQTIYREEITKITKKEKQTITLDTE